MNQRSLNQYTSESKGRDKNTKDKQTGLKLKPHHHALKQVIEPCNHIQSIAEGQILEEDSSQMSDLKLQSNVSSISSVEDFRIQIKLDDNRVDTQSRQFSVQSEEHSPIKHDLLNIFDEEFKFDQMNKAPKKEEHMKQATRKLTMNKKRISTQQAFIGIGNGASP